MLKQETKLLIRNFVMLSLANKPLMYSPETFYTSNYHGVVAQKKIVPFELALSELGVVVSLQVG